MLQYMGDFDQFLRHLRPPQRRSVSALIPVEWSESAGTFETLSHPNGSPKLFVVVGRYNAGGSFMDRQHSVSNPAVLSLMPLREIDAQMLTILRRRDVYISRWSR